MTDTTPMRIKLARALCSDFDALPDAATYMHRKSNPDKHWLDKGEVLSDVDALLNVLETPTKAMVIAGNSPRGYTMDGYPQPHTSTDVGAAMVKAIRGGA